MSAVKIPTFSCVGCACTVLTGLLVRQNWLVADPRASTTGLHDFSALNVDANVQVARFEPTVAGDYVVALRASDSVVFGEWSPVPITVLAANRAPTLARSLTQEVVIEGAAASEINALASLDLDGDAITVTSTKISGGRLGPCEGGRPADKRGSRSVGLGALV